MLKCTSFEKKLVKPLKNCFFGPNLHRKGVIMDYAQDEKKFFLVQITKADHQLSDSFYFIKIWYVLMFWLSYEFFSILSDVFSKKCHFQLKQLCSIIQSNRSCLVVQLHIKVGWQVIPYTLSHITETSEMKNFGRTSKVPKHY